MGIGVAELVLVLTILTCIGLPFAAFALVALYAFLKSRRSGGR